MEKYEGITDTYPQLADACFALDDTYTDQTTLTVRNVPFTWDGMSDRDLAGAAAVGTYIVKHKLTQSKSLQLVWVCCKGVKQDA